MSKRIWTSVLVIGLVAALAGIGTYALYTDTASSAGNTMAAGVLDLKVADLPGSGVYSDTMVPMSLTNLAPGDYSWAWHWQAYLTANEGDVPGGKLTFKIDNVAPSGGEYPPPEQAVDDDNSGDLADNVKVAVWFPTWGEGDLLGEYTIAQLEAGITITEDFDADVAANGGSALVEFDAILPETAGNAVMGDGLTFDGHFTLEQKH